MCHAASDLECYTDLVHRPQTSKTAKMHVLRLRRNGRRLSKLKKMKMKNLKLYKQNKTIIEENERLRNKARLLHQENKALFSQILIQQLYSNITIN
ncbi:hypothetical protein HAX54_023439 [Datura stramonium]|uniref:Uncharacterized protein n=1 Tax=Datura stramonium TaxID=4076 RepID=A0ABS8S5K2_DATST|nr:hypothetical protein [Datura stramonium]